MPEYTYLCKNNDCDLKAFSFVCSVHEKVDEYLCPKCSTITTSRVFYPTMHTYKLDNPMQARGVHKIEERLRREYTEAKEISDNVYNVRSENSTKKWIESGGKEKLLSDLAEQDFIKDKTSIISTSSGTTTVGTQQ